MGGTRFPCGPTSAATPRVPRPAATAAYVRLPPAAQAERDRVPPELLRIRRLASHLDIPPWTIKIHCQGVHSKGSASVQLYTLRQQHTAALATGRPLGKCVDVRGASSQDWNTGTAVGPATAPAPRTGYRSPTALSSIPTPRNARTCRGESPPTARRSSSTPATTALAKNSNHEERARGAAAATKPPRPTAPNDREVAMLKVTGYVNSCPWWILAPGAAAPQGTGRRCSPRQRLRSGGTGGGHLRLLPDAARLACSPRTREYRSRCGDRSSCARRTESVPRMRKGLCRENQACCR